MSLHASLVLPPRSEVARQARSFLRAQLTRWGWSRHDAVPGLLDDALLALSELVTNAVRHGSGEVEVVIEYCAGELELRVRDMGDLSSPLRPSEVPLTSVSGRGLTIVEALSTEWGVIDAAPGKTVWCRLAVAPGSSLRRHDSVLSGRGSRPGDGRGRRGVLAT